MNRLFALFVAAVIAVVISVPASFAQPCDGSPNNGIISLGQSLCLQVCPFELYAYTLEDGGQAGPENYPILTMAAGCNALNTNCDVFCTALDPPDTLVFGADPFDPDSYFGSNDCFEIHLYWVHDDVWTIEIFSFCEGCFCITYDRQLPVELMEFTAQSGIASIELRWATGSESETDYFELERDGHLVTYLDAKGSSSAGSSYTWTDYHVATGVVYEYTLFEVTVSGARVRLGSVLGSATDAPIPGQYALYQNYPNPFNPETSIQFDLAKTGFVSLKVYTPIGQEVTTLVSREMSSGRHTIRFNSGAVASGMYLYRLEAGEFSDAKKMVVLK